MLSECLIQLDTLNDTTSDQTKIGSAGWYSERLLKCQHHD